MSWNNLVLRVGDSLGLDRHLPLGHNERRRESVVGSIVFIDRGSVVEWNLKDLSVSDVVLRRRSGDANDNPPASVNEVSTPKYGVQKIHITWNTRCPQTRIPRADEGFGIIPADAEWLSFAVRTRGTKLDAPWSPKPSDEGGGRT